MGRSYVFGILIGGLCSVLGLGMVSLMAPSGTTSRAMAENGSAGEVPTADEVTAEEFAAADATAETDGAEAMASEQSEAIVLSDEAATEAASDAVSEPTTPEAAPQTAVAETVASAEALTEPDMQEAPAAEIVSETEEDAAESELPKVAETATEMPDMTETVVEDTAGVPDAPVVEVPPGSEFARARPEADMLVPAAENGRPSVGTPAVVMPEAEPAPELAEVNPAAMPEGQSESPGEIATPEAPEPIVLAEAPAADSAVPFGEAASTPVLAAQDPAAAVLPDSSVPEAPAEPEAPAAEEEIAAADPVAPDVAVLPEPEPQDTPAIAPEPAELPAPESAEAQEPAVTESADGTDLPESDVAEATEGTDPDAGTELAEANEPDSAGEIETGTDAAPIRRLPQIEAPDETPGDTAETEVAEAEEPDAGTGIGDSPAALDLSPQPPIGAASAPQPGFAKRIGVKINRLPRIGDDVPANADGVAEGVPAPAALPSVSTGEPAATRYAAPFDNSGGLPFLSVVITDIGEEAGGLDPAALAAFGAHVTIAIDPARADASARAAAYRLAGHEVAILAPDLPEGATASDLEVAYQGYGSELPEAVALIGAPDAAFQRDRRVAQHMVALLSTEGRGLVTYDRGLNPARQAAIGEGLAHASVFRALDADGEGASTIARYLDRAAFEAARQGDVVIVATSRPETISALQDWIAAGAKGTVVAPVSAAMAAEG
ncbi:hypothetical protein DEA8626_01243 [Defluviimonas aquaemixtae]|uniref:Divergent polysaccharide deacetylase n=1 Tax=Albidovulum aquaemixtae TaxID=1542388 RepID=A0A2R8B545_9RHOB|nr:divergent polysaccharide deacetylase family protein [Defluviimonas aquaemixtae]SPH17717.1 hypothetical protein DEA8626_01243 [Defluviimonas aquaemixtae]